MSKSIFTTLCDLCDELDRLQRDLEPGPVADRLRDLVKRFDAVIDRTVGVVDVHVPGAE